jgi:microcystin-dependent protein
MTYIPPKYPDEIPDTNDLPDKTDHKELVHADHINAIKEELRAALVELGTNPKGAYDDVAARLTALAEAAIPAGLIAIWHGLLADIPDGWVLCDGTNGTPNLLDKFVKGVADDETDPGDTGGEASVTLAAADLPSHKHSIANSGTHQHTISSSGNHAHKTNAGGEAAFEYGDYAGPEYTPNTDTSQAGDHNHGGNAGAGGNHNHGAETGAIGSGAAHENRPPFYEVAFIMKT